MPMNEEEARRIRQDCVNHARNIASSPEQVVPKAVELYDFIMSGKRPAKSEPAADLEQPAAEVEEKPEG